MDKASVYGTGDCRFESYQDHIIAREFVPKVEEWENFFRAIDWNQAQFENR